MTVKISGNSSSSTPSFAGDDGDSGLHATADQVQLVTNGTVGVTVDSSQNVGIGTTSPSSLSELRGSAQLYSSAAGFTFTDSAGQAGSNRWFVGNVAANTYGDFSISSAPNTSSTTYTSRLLINSYGNVGIGTTNPTGFIHVQGSSTGIETYGRFTTGSLGGDQSLVIKSGSSRDHMAIQVSTNSGTADDLALQPDGGKVGIGTTSPADTLQINKNATSASNGGLTLKTANSNESLLTIGVSTSLDKAFISSLQNGTGSARPLSFIVGTSSSQERMRIGTAGKIQIIGSSYLRFDPAAATNGTYLQFTSSQFRIGNDSAGSGNYVYLSAGATSWSGSSDERLKTDLVPIEDGLNKVGSLRAVTGRFLDDEQGTSRSFLIAQDVQSVLPEAVDDSNPDQLGLAYTDVIPLLVAALKESKERIETLEAKVAALEGGTNP